MGPRGEPDRIDAWQAYGAGIPGGLCATGGGEALQPHIRELINYDGVHLLDRREIHIDHTIADLATIVIQSTRASGGSIDVGGG